MDQRGRPDMPAGEMAPAGYRLITLLGRGGMGEVYLADDLTLGRKVAVKFLLPEKTNDSKARKRLLHEAQAAAAVDHPHICTVYETGETADGRVYIVMQYVEGETLARVLERGPMSVRDALALSARIADALAEAHRRGVVHRDLKPANVMIMPSGRPKILDLGIAKVAHPIASSDESTHSNVTMTGGLVGTPGYMSPEQVQHHPLDGRCDLFSLGVLLFECLTGHRAFQGTTTLETIANVLHVHPPAPSSLRPELTERHDELCRRLMAKDPADRFQSAEEVVGAIRVLAPDTSRTSAVLTRDWRSMSLPARRRVAAALVILIVAALGLWSWTRPRSLPPVSKASQSWYEEGTDAIREGTYFSAVKALQEAVRESAGHALAYARLAEAHAELDDDDEARKNLLMVSTIVPNETRLPETERLRLQAVRALVLRDLDTAVSLYRRLVNVVSYEPGAWLDLGRAQEAAGLRTEALESYQRAVSEDPKYGAAWLRLGTLLGFESKREEALKAFDEAERWYRASANDEGEAEVLIRRGILFDALFEPKLARAQLERARAIAQRLRSHHQLVRIELALSSVTATEGDVPKAREIAEAAVQQAVANRLETVAAEGLINLASFVQIDRPAEAVQLLERAMALATNRGARRTHAWARLQMANVRRLQLQHEESIDIVDAELPFLRTHAYRRFELQALSIKTRALERLGRLDEARGIAESVLSIAQQVHDDGQVLLAGSNLASVLTALGAYPEALQLRERIEPIRVRHGDNENLPYDLANRADLLIRLGKTAAADTVLADLERGIASAQPAYARLTRRVAFLQAMAAAAALRCADVRRQLGRLAQQRAVVDTAGIVAPGLAAFCDAREHLGAFLPLPDGADPIARRERHYWLAAAALERRDFKSALDEVRSGLALLRGQSNDELRWRLSAIGAIAARESGDAQGADDMSRGGLAALESVKTSWGPAFTSYLERPDLLSLRKRWGLT